MRLFFDLNVLLDVALRREPHFLASDRILADSIANHSCFLSWHTISNISYILGKIEGGVTALNFIRNITSVCQGAPVEHSDLANAFRYNHNDFEDSMQIASAISCNAEFIITRDPGGFSKPPIPIMNPG